MEVMVGEGYLCDSDDVRAFAEGVKRLRENKELRERMSERNRKAVISILC